jgi:hypothetical protein
MTIDPNVIELSAAAMRALLDEKPTMSKATRLAIEKHGAIFETAEGQKFRTKPDPNADGPTHRADLLDLVAVPIDAVHGPN